MFGDETFYLVKISDLVLAPVKNSWDINCPKATCFFSWLYRLTDMTKNCQHKPYLGSLLGIFVLCSGALKHAEASPAEQIQQGRVWLGNQAIPGNDTPPIIKLSSLSVQIFQKDWKSLKSTIRELYSSTIEFPTSCFNFQDICKC